MQLPTEPERVLVVGAGGLLGGAIMRSSPDAVRPEQVSWQAPQQALSTLLAASGSLVDGDAPWSIAWCAGAGVVATTEEDLHRENELLEQFLTTLGGHLDANQGTRPRAVLLASSAGGVYGGSAGSPFTESTEARPISPYGWAKLRAEQLVTEFASSTGVPGLIARIANLYGPGQNLAKPQGLIAQLCRSQLMRQPLGLYVPLDTARDFIFVDDAAAIITDWLQDPPPSGSAQVKIIASQQSVPVSVILAELGPGFPSPPVGGAGRLTADQVPGHRAPFSLPGANRPRSSQSHPARSGHGRHPRIGPGSLAHG